MANSKRKCGYKPCSAMFRPESGNVGTVVFCKPECRILKFTAKPKVKVKAKRVKLKTMARLKEDCAVTLQLLVRVKAAVAANRNGQVQCVTCGKWDHYKAMQGGHFLERGRGATKLVEENCAPQCPQCNAWKMKTTSGVLAYRDYMVATYGEKAVQELIALSKQVWKPTRSEVETIHNDYKARLDALEREL